MMVLAQLMSQLHYSSVHVWQIAPAPWWQRHMDTMDVTKGLQGLPIRYIQGYFNKIYYECLIVISQEQSSGHWPGGSGI